VTTTLSRLATATLRLLTILLLLVSAVSAPATASAAILDASRGGDASFFWLAPTVASAPASTGFNSTLLNTLAVEVCILAPSGGCRSGAPMARLTSSSAATPGRLTLDAANQYYSVDWQTATTPYFPDATYRARVLRGGAEIGFLDVVFVLNKPQLGLADAGRFKSVMRGQVQTLRFRVR
jgi:hypothetical protein